MSGQIGPDSLGARVVGDIASGSILWSATLAALAVLGVVSQALIDRSLEQQRWEDDYAMSDRAIMGALGGEVERDRSGDYNQFDDDEVETVDEFRRRRIEEEDPDRPQQS